MEGDGHRGLPAEGFPEATQGGLEVCLDHKAAHRDGLQTGTGIRMHVCAHKKVRVHETGGWVGEALGVEFSNTQAMRSPTPELTHRHIHTSSHIRAQTHPHVLTHVHRWTTLGTRYWTGRHQHHIPVEGEHKRARGGLPATPHRVPWPKPRGAVAGGRLAGVKVGQYGAV